MKIELDRIVKDLDTFRVHFDVFSSEKVIRADNAIEKELEFLKNYIYEADNALYLKTTAFVDDKDRVVKKSNGDYTYFMPDICYHVTLRKMVLLISSLAPSSTATSLLAFLAQRWHWMDE